MNCKAHVLGLALLTALIMCLLGAAGASAAEFTASKYPTSLTASSALENDKLVTEGGSVECKTHSEGTLAAASTSMTIIAAYSACRAFGFLNATVIMGCDYVLHASGTTDIECPATNKIVITAGTCEVQIGTQTGLNSVQLGNGSGDVNAKASLSGIKYTVTKDGFGCPFTSTGEKTGATYTQGSAVTFASTNGATAHIAESPKPGKFTASSYPTGTTAESAVGNTRFTTEAGSAECKAHFQGGSLIESSPSLTLTPTYTECKAFGFLSMVVTMNGCDYVFKEPVGALGSYNAKVDIVCPAGKAIEIVSGTCKVTIAAQNFGTGASITNAGGGDVTFKANLTGIAYTVIQDGFGCPFAGTGAKTGGTYTTVNAITLDSTNGANFDVG